MKNKLTKKPSSFGICEVFGVRRWGGILRLEMEAMFRKLNCGVSICFSGILLDCCPIWNLLQDFDIFLMN